MTLKTGGDPPKKRYTHGFLVGLLDVYIDIRKKKYFCKYAVNIHCWNLSKSKQLSLLHLVHGREKDKSKDKDKE